MHNIIQKDFSGDKIIYNVSPDYTRQLTDELQEEIISALKSLDVSSVSVRFEHSVDTTDFVDLVCQFLKNNGYKVYANGFTMSNISKNEFSIKRHNSDPTFASIKIGSLNN
jgi:hypothetical protein